MGFEMTRASLRRGGLLVLLSIVLAGSSHAQRSFEEAFGIEKKYYVKDCVVKLNLQWPPATTELVRERVGYAIDVQISKALVSAVAGEFPLFSGGTTWERKYYVFYYADQCEHRRQLLQALVEKYLVPSIPEFPDYHIEDEGIEPGFDGAGPPQGWWLDDEADRIQ